MKTVKTIFLALIAIFATNYVMASGGLKVDFSDSENNATLVEMSTAEITHFEIKLSDKYGDKIYSLESAAPSNSFNKKFDFSTLENGTYWFSVEVNKERTLKKLNVKEGKVTIEKVRKSIEPHFIHDGEMLKFSFINPQMEKVGLYVYDSNSGLLAKADLGKDFTIHKAVDLSELRRGDYNVVITNDMDIYEYNFSIR
jgi:hypothetical protein